MASLEQLKKKLQSVELTKQLTTAMKTVSSAKYSKLNRIFSAFKIYMKELDKFEPYCSGFGNLGGNSTDKQLECFVIMGYNRGFCGSYNSELHAFATSVLEKHKDYILIVCGKNAISYFDGKTNTNFDRYILPDVPDYSSCKPFIDRVIELYTTGKVSSVSIIYQNFISTMTQEPALAKILPFPVMENEQNDMDALLIPDKETVLDNLQLKVIESKIYKIILEAAIGAQSATLLAMRTAVDHATDTAEVLGNEIHKKRQSAVTNGVIETGSTSSSEEEG